MRTHVRHIHHLLCDYVVKDEGERHLIVIIQQRVNGLLQAHQPVFLLHTERSGGSKNERSRHSEEGRDDNSANSYLFNLLLTQVQHGLSHLGERVLHSCRQRQTTQP